MSKIKDLSISYTPTDKVKSFFSKKQCFGNLTFKFTSEDSAKGFRENIEKTGLSEIFENTDVGLTISVKPSSGKGTKGAYIAGKGEIAINCGDESTAAAFKTMLFGGALDMAVHYKGVSAIYFTKDYTNKLQQGEKIDINLHDSSSSLSSSTLSSSYSDSASSSSSGSLSSSSSEDWKDSGYTSKEEYEGAVEKWNDNPGIVAVPTYSSKSVIAKNCKSDFKEVGIKASYTPNKGKPSEIGILSFKFDSLPLKNKFMGKMKEGGLSEIFENTDGGLTISVKPSSGKGAKGAYIAGKGEIAINCGSEEAAATFKTALFGDVPDIAFKDKSAIYFTKDCTAKLYQQQEIDINWLDSSSPLSSSSLSSSYSDSSSSSCSESLSSLMSSTLSTGSLDSSSTVSEPSIIGESVSHSQEAGS